MKAHRWKGRLRRPVLLLVALLVVATSCGDSPFLSLGERSSRWVTEPTVLTTTTVPTTIPVVRDAGDLIWYNDDLGEGPVEPAEVVAAVFARREGDRFIQASRAEISKVLTGIKFPERVPPLSEYVTSQLVIDNNGEVSDDPSAAFGIWTAEPYTRSRSVAQMIVLRVYRDAETAAEILTEGADLSCTRFAGSETSTCDVTEVGGATTWILESTAGITLIWFDDIYRYEMFGRPFAAREGLIQTAASMMPLPLIAESS